MLIELQDMEGATIEVELSQVERVERRGAKTNLIFRDESRMTIGEDVDLLRSGSLR